jgi:hypothetical protein
MHRTPDDDEVDYTEHVAFAINMLDDQALELADALVGLTIDNRGHAQEKIFDLAIETAIDVLGIYSSEAAEQFRADMKRADDDARAHAADILGALARGEARVLKPDEMTAEQRAALGLPEPPLGTIFHPGESSR